MDPFLGEIGLFPSNRIPSDWVLCDGRQMPLSQNQALFSLLGIVYGGDGKTYFNLPDLRGRVPVHVDFRTSAYAPGKMGGKEGVVLTNATVPPHQHIAFAVAAGGTNAASPSTNLPGVNTKGPFSGTIPVPNLYSSQATNLVTIDPSTVGVDGGDGAHENRQPSIAMSYCIAIRGTYPSRS